MSCWRRTFVVYCVLLCLGIVSISSVAENADVTTPASTTPDDTKDPSTATTATRQPDAKPVVVHAEQDTVPSRYAIPLTSKNFSDKVGDGNVWLIEFYTPWCRHCQEFARSYDTVAANFHMPPNQGFRVGKVDCDSEKALRARFGIRSYPSFFVVDGWSVYEFDKPRTEVALMDFLRGGYKKQEPISFYTSPMGPMGLLQGFLIYVGSLIMSIFESIQASGVPPLVAGIALSFIAVVGGMISVVALAILTTPKAKND